MIFIHPIDIPNMKTGMIAPKCIWNKAKITLVIKIDFLGPYFGWNLFNRKPLNKISSDIGAIKIATVQKMKKDLLEILGIEFSMEGGENKFIEKIM